MPIRPLKPCAYISCSRLVTPGHRFCAPHLKRERAHYDGKRDKDTRALYNYRWNKYSKQYIKNNPLCVCPECREKKYPLPSEVVDHIKPHKGDYELFWDETNHQAMAKVCHDKKTAIEDGGWGRGD